MVESSTRRDVSDSWYEVIQTVSLRQGDIFRDIVACWIPKTLDPASLAGDEVGALVGDRATGDFIVASASCDVAQRGYEYVLLNQVLVAAHENLSIQPNELQKNLEAIRRGAIPSKFLLAEHPSCSPPMLLSFVTSKIHVLLPLDYLVKACAKPRLRLRSPVREAFGNWVGMCFSRVGVEDQGQIERFVKQLSPAQLTDALGVE